MQVYPVRLYNINLARVANFVKRQEKYSRQS